MKVALALIVLLVACRPSKHPPSTSSSTVVVSNAGESHVTVAEGDSRIDVVLKTELPLTVTSSTFDGVSRSEIRVGAELLVIEHAELTIGARSFGTLPANARVEIRSDGVYVDGEKRGELAR